VKKRAKTAVVIAINPADNVAVAVEFIDRGSSIQLDDGSVLTARTDIPKNHKLALRAIRAGARVVKYGESIGLAKERIEAGEWVHTHNLTAEES
jgi:altronate dehydratase